MQLYQIEDRLMEMSVYNRLALGLRLMAIGVGLLLIIDGKPPAAAQSHASYDSNAQKAEDWHIEQQETNAGVDARLKDLDSRCRMLEQGISDLNGKITGGVGFITVLTGMAVFFQLKKKEKGD